MNAREKKYVAVLAACVVFLFLLEWFMPKQLDWTPTYSRHDKIPYGTYLIYEELPAIFPGQQISPLTQTLYEYYQEDSLRSGQNFVVITGSFTPDKLELAALLKYVEGGAHAFVSAENFGDDLQDTLGIEATQSLRMDNMISQDTTPDQTRLVNPRLDEGKPYLHKRSVMATFLRADRRLAGQVAILGKDSTGAANFLRIAHGKGAFYLHSAPKLLTNYHFLRQPNEHYIAHCLSYLPKNQEVVWMDYYAFGRGEVATPLRYILKTEALRWAWFTALALMTAYVLFNLKRRQRVIPVMTAPANTTLEFVETIGKLYYQTGDHHNLALKKIRYLKEYIRQHYYLATNVIDDEFYQALAAKSAKPVEQVRQLFGLVANIEAATSLSEKDLHALHAAIADFKKAAPRQAR